MSFFKNVTNNTKCKNTKYSEVQVKMSKTNKKNITESKCVRVHTLL